MVAATLLAVAAAWFVRAWWIPQGEKLVPFGDTILYYYPGYKAFFEAVARGEVPLWNPYPLGGVPWIPELQLGVFYPPHLVFLLLPTGWAMASMSLFHLLLVAIATIALGRRIGLGPMPTFFAAFVAAIGFTFQGAVTPNTMEVSAWFLPGLLATLELARVPSRRYVALLGLSCGAGILAGYPQFTAYSVYGWATVFLVLLVARRPTLTEASRSSVAFGAGLAIGALVGAVLLLPTAELSWEGTRALEKLRWAHLWPFGQAKRFEDAFLFLSSAKRPLSFVALVMGALFVPFALVPRGSRPLTVALLVVFVLAALVAMGPATPVFSAYLWLPAMPSFRNPNRILFLRDACFPLLVAIGMQGLFQLLRQFVPRRASTLVAATNVVVGVALLLLVIAPLRWKVIVPYFGSAGVGHFDEPPAELRQFSDSEDRVFPWHRSLFSPLAPRVATFARMRSTAGFEPMSLRRQAEYFGYLHWGEEGPPPKAQPFHGTIPMPKTEAAARDFASRQRLLDLAAARFVVAQPGLAPKNAFTVYRDEVGLRDRTTPGSRIWVFENDRALPRAYVTHRVLPAPPTEELLGRLAAPSFDPMDESYVEGTIDFALPAAPVRGRPAEIVRDDPSVVEVEAELPAPGLLVLADSFYPSWRATVDGVPAPILPTNHLFRGVPVPAGTHRVRFEYEPTALLWGACLTGLGLIALVVLVLPWPRSNTRPGD